MDIGTVVGGPVAKVGLRNEPGPLDGREGGSPLTLDVSMMLLPLGKVLGLLDKPEAMWKGSIATEYNVVSAEEDFA